MSTRAWWETACVALVALSLCVLIAAGIYYLPLQVDGGWYSYPAFALVHGRSPFSNQMSLASACETGGLQVLFRFDTGASIRVLYTGAWMYLFGSGFLSVKLLSLAEFALLCVAASLMYRKFFGNRKLALLAVGFLVTDKTLVLAGVSEFRPDLALAALSVALFVVLETPSLSRRRMALALLLSALIPLIAVTSPVPLAFVLVAAGASAILGDVSERRSRVTLVLAMTAIAVAMFVARLPLFHAAFAYGVHVHEPVDAVGRIAAVLKQGPLSLLRKELHRWSDYFLLTNVPLLCVLGWSFAALLFRGTDGRRIPPKLRGPLFGLAAAILVLVFLDPHPTEYHLIPLMPFMLLLLARFETYRPPHLRLLVLLLAASAVLGLGLAVRTWRSNTKRGTNNWWLASTLARLTEAPKAYVIVGPAELWPYLPQDRNIILFDKWRTPQRLAEEGDVLRNASFVVVNADYSAQAWRTALTKTGYNPLTVVGKAPYLTVWRGNRPMNRLDCLPGGGA